MYFFFFLKNFTSHRTRNMNACPRVTFKMTFKKFITIIAIGRRSSPVIYFENKKEI